MPLSQVEFEELLPQLGLTDAGKIYLDQLRSSQPARRVQSNVVANCCYRYVSRRMGFALMAESHLEYQFLLRCEFGFGDLVEYWEQPPSVGIEGTDSRGRRYRTGHVADVITISLSGVCVYEMKPYEECCRLNARRPTDWVRTHRGFDYRPAQEAFRQLGIKHAVITDQDLHPIESANYEVLLHARDVPTSINHEALIRKATLTLTEERALPMRALLRRLNLDDVTPVLKMIERGFLKTKLDLQPLTNIDDTWVALDGPTLDTALEAIQLVWPAMPCTEQILRSRVPCAKESLEMMSRLRQIQGQTPPLVSGRTLRRWQARLRQASDASALLPCKFHRGNRHKRLSASHEQLISSVIDRFYNTADNWKPYRCYGAYRRELARHWAQDKSDPGLKNPISLVSFLRRIKGLDPEKSALARGGKRAANAAAAPVEPHKRLLLAARAFQRAHIDHTELDVHLKVMESGGRVFTLRPWLTVMVDEYSGAILAMSLGFRAPSRRACALILRDCALRHRRLPETIVVDNGKEFESTYFEACLARLGIHKQSRPPGHPRYGSTVERVFGTLNNELLLTLPGNSSNIASDRSKSSSHKGMNRASLSLLELYELLIHYFFDVYNQHASGDRAQPPMTLVHESLQLFAASGRPIDVDHAFLIETAIECRGMLKVDPQRGIRHNGRFYSHGALRAANPRSKFEVREEPWDVNCIYAHVDQRWLACYHGPHPGDQKFTRAKICASTLWLDTSKVRAEAKQGRLRRQRSTSRDWNRNSKPSTRPVFASNSVSATPLFYRPSPKTYNPFPSSGGKTDGHQGLR
jgi:putative transposase